MSYFRYIIMVVLMILVLVLMVQMSPQSLKDEKTADPFREAGSQKRGADAATSQTRARVIHCDDIILGLGATGSYLASLAKDFPNWRICGVDIGKKESDLTLPSNVPWPYSAPDAVRMLSGMYLTTGNLLNTYQEYNTVNQPQLLTLDPQTGQITNGRSPVTGYARVVGGGPNTNTGGDRVPARRVIDEDLDMPNFKWHEWHQDFAAMPEEIGINKIPVLDAFQPEIKHLAREAFNANGYYNNPDMRNGNILGSDGTTFCVVPADPTNPFILNRTSAGLRFVEDYAGNTPSSNLIVLSQTRADYVVLHGRNNLAKGVWVTNITSGEHIYLKKHRGEVFSCMGTKGDAEFLLRSGIYDAHKLHAWKRPVRVDNPNVGKRMWSHWNMRWILSVNESLAITPKIPDFELQSGIFGFGPISADYSAKNSWSIGVNQLSVPLLPPYETVALFELQLYDIKSRGNIAWSSPLPNATAYIDYGIFNDPRDVQLARRLIPEAMKIVNHSAMKMAYPNLLYPPTQQFNLSNPDEAEKFARIAIVPAYHDGGTVPMGRFTDRRRVLDTQLRVVGTVGLRVASSAVFPVPLRVNMASPCMALGRRLRRLVVEERRNRHWRRARDAEEFNESEAGSTYDMEEFDEGTPESLRALIALDVTETMAVPQEYYNSEISSE